MGEKNTKKKGKALDGKMVAIGAGVAALGAGAYYLLGHNAKAHQKKALALMVKIKKEVGSEMKKMKNATEPTYHKAVDAISLNYIKQYKAHEAEIKAFTKKLKSEWKGVPELASKKAKGVTRSLKNKKV